LASQYIARSTTKPAACPFTGRLSMTAPNRRPLVIPPNSDEGVFSVPPVQMVVRLLAATSTSRTADDPSSNSSVTRARPGNEAVLAISR
jgi:hypothetical protein